MPQRTSDVTKPLLDIAWSQVRMPGCQQQMIRLTAIFALMLVILACGLSRPASEPTVHRVIIRTHLPTLTPTANFATIPEVVVVQAAYPTPSPSSYIDHAANSVSATPPDANPSPFQSSSDDTSSPLPTSTAYPVEQTGNPSTLNQSVQFPTPTSTSTPTPVDVFSPTSTLVAATPEIMLPQGWGFSGVRVSTDPDEGDILLHGDVVNNTGVSQALNFISSTFFDAQGQAIPNITTIDYWPIEAIPPGGRVPFELRAPGLQSTSNFDLNVEAGPSSTTPYQDFNFSDINQFIELDDYCIEGKLQKSGSSLGNYLVIVIVLYDPQDNVINFGDYYVSEFQSLANPTVDFQICVSPLGQEVTRYELRAWGE
jgi:hypothetical protein